MEFILETTPETRRTLLFSATFPRGIVALARQYQRDAFRIEVAGDEGGHADIDYRAIRIAPGDVEHAVVNVLRFFEAPSALVFCSTRDAVRHLQAALLERGFAVVALSGELTQNERTLALQSLRDGRARVCVATDVAARGIDLPSLDLVIHERRARRQAVGRDQAARREEDRRSAGDEPEPARGHPVGTRHRPRARRSRRRRAGGAGLGGHAEALERVGDTYHSSRNWRHLRADGSEIEVLTFGRLVTFDDRDGYLVAVVDITERRKAEARIAHMAHHDGLTDLPNREYFQERLKQALDQAGGKRVGVLYIDLDLFKNINDSFGHPSGDRLLKEVAERLTTAVRGGNLAARLGGDEFAVILAADVSPNEASACATLLIDMIGRHRLESRRA